MHLSFDSDALTDEEWMMQYMELVWIRKKEAGK
jgi:hypothetical protein